MQSFRTFLAELVNRPYPFKTFKGDPFRPFSEDSPEWGAIFTTEEPRSVQFLVRFHWEQFIPEWEWEQFIPAYGIHKDIRREDGIWMFSFKLRDHHTPANKTSWDIVASGGQEIRILSTIVAILQDLVEKTEPGLIGFTAKEPSRKKLYQRFVRHASRYLPGYEGSGPIPEEIWHRWMGTYHEPGALFLLHRTMHSVSRHPGDA